MLSSLRSLSDAMGEGSPNNSLKDSGILIVAGDGDDGDGDDGGVAECCSPDRPATRPPPLRQRYCSAVHFVDAGSGDAHDLLARNELPGLTDQSGHRKVVNDLSSSAFFAIGPSRRTQR